MDVKFISVYTSCVVNILYTRKKLNKKIFTLYKL